MTATRQTDRKLLATYLDDHVAGATVGLSRVRRMARAYEGTPVGDVVGPMVDQLDTEREFLITTTKDLGFHVSRYKVVLAAVAERVGRLTPNGRVVRQSPLSALLEVELVRGAVTGKLSGWRTLQQLPGDAVVDRARAAELEEQARRQVDDLTALLERLRPAALTRPRD
ncbi:hypothetical protein [Cellulosimicrobium arenosum]|uniref:Uncharacterized protein n=1 Tax=Cellulosimicrobium arenosum TaxID=2708133 RepID=A0A927G8S7_9MICO|nr:hypothetical protein [Cellulosimicrobium arenosum]MBD8078420.1 hypothetical protein [Cellulosimicrobium arenosum]